MELVDGLSSMNTVLDNLQEQLRRVQLEKDVEKKEFKRLIQKARQYHGYERTDEDDAQYRPPLRCRIPTQTQRVNGNEEAGRQPVNSTELPGLRESEIHHPL